MWLRRQFLLGLGALVLAGCAQTKVITDPILGPDHVVGNVFRKEAMLPGTMRRVALLPLTADVNQPGYASGRQTLEPILRTELAKAGLFDVVYVSPTDLQKWSGKERWDFHEVLPPDLLRTIARQTGSDGVLFARLSRYHAYPPIVVGWHMVLSDNDAELIWSVDETFDAAEQAVSNTARRYDRAQARNNPILEDSRSILLSPRRFGQYTLDAIVQTLPRR